MPSTARDTTPDRATLVEILEELVNLSAGLGVMLLPVLVLSVPGLILFFVLPAVLLGAVAAALAAIGAALVAPPYLVLRFVRRRRGRSGSAPVAAAVTLLASDRS